MPEKHSCPDVLRFSRMIGEHHLLLSGGVLDQPVIMRAVRYAGWLDDLWRRMNTDKWKAENEDEFRTMNQINEVRAKLENNG